MDLDQVFGKVISRMCEDINTPRSLAVYLMVKYGELLQLTSVSVQPMHYLDDESYFKDAAVTEFLRKCDIPGLRSQSLLRRECFERLLTTERQCAATNARLSRFVDAKGPFEHVDDLRILEVISAIQRKIRYVVGSVTNSVFDEVGFGPGATLTNPGKLSTLPDKLESSPAGTSRALYHFNTLFSQSAWVRHGDFRNTGVQQIARGNRFFTVPKDANKLRGACLSPNVNGFLQKGVGSYLRNRLRRVGIRIHRHDRESERDLTPYMHSELAEHGSRCDTWATIDLSDASNTISLRLIELLWPREWFELLCDLREPFCEGPGGKTIKLEMLSAMGNGFTFEVETITFWAIAAVLSNYDGVTVFGDDIIVPQHCGADVVAALRFFGFTTNPRKTFLSGPFRESCGGDFWDGVPVRAHYVKDIPQQPADWISLANGIRRMAFGSPVTEHRWSYLRRAWLCCLSALPLKFRSLRGPESIGDAVIHDYRETWSIRTTGPLCWNTTGYHWVVGLKAKQRPLDWGHWNARVVLAAALYGADQDGPIPRSGLICHRRGLIPILS